jgi:hypothetical protein
VIDENEAFLLGNPDVRAQYAEAFKATRALYYKSQPEFDDILEEISKYIKRL